MRTFATTRRNRPILKQVYESWIRALNTLVSNTQIKPNELAEAEDIQLVEDGKIQCPRDGQAYFGSESGTRVVGLYPFYKSDGTRKLLRTSGTKLQYLSGSTWTDVSGYTYTSGLLTSGAMAYDRLYLVNGTDPLTYYDGSTITSFTAISKPGAPTVTRTGTAGSFTFSYKITAVTNVGETDGSTAGSTTLNQGTLDTTSYMTVTWSAVTNAIGYNVYGRKDGQWYFLKYLEGNTSTTYIDKGTETPEEAFTPPEGNSTGGPTGTQIAVYKDSLFILGDPNNPSRLYYSGGGDKIHDFTVSGGGGFIDIAKNDGQKGTGLVLFKNSMITFKDGSVYQFSFTTDGLPQVVQVTSAVGCIAPRGIVVVENDVFFPSDRGIFSIGNEAGFSFDVLRTNELSVRVRTVYRTIDPAYIQNIAAIYANDPTKNLVIFSYTPSGSTTNSKALVYDRERLGWYKWTNIKANCWTTYKGTDGVIHFLYGDDSSGYVKEILTGSDDFGSAIQGTFRLKAESFKGKDSGLDSYKTLKDINLVLRKPIGTITLTIIKDGVETVYTNNIGTISPAINFAHYVFSRFLFGVSYGTGAVTSQDDNVRRVIENLNLVGRSFQIELTNSTSGGSFTLLQASMTAKPRSSRYKTTGELVA